MDTADTLRRAIALHQQGEYSAAIHCYQQILAYDPGDADAWHLYGLACRAQGELNEALAHIRQAIAYNADQAVYYFNLANILHELDQIDDAIEAYRRAIELDPDDADFYCNLGNVLQETGDVSAAQRCYEQALLRNPRLATAHNNLGGLWQAQGHWQAAAQCYRAALNADPDCVQAHRNYAAVLEQNGDVEKAVLHYERVLQLQPDYAEVQYKLAALRGRQAPSAAPSEYVAALFDQYADEFDQHLVDTLEYQTPQQLRALYDRCCPAGHVRILDLGCGTGLSGMAFVDRAVYLAGVDLSSKMIERAAARGIYQQLEVADILPYLSALDRQFDIILAADVMVYIGDLARLFDGCRRCLVAGGVMVFSVENWNGDGDYALQASGRYAHSHRYITQLAAQAGFTLMALESSLLRKNQGEAVTGLIAVLQRMDIQSTRL